MSYILILMRLLVLLTAVYVILSLVNSLGKSKNTNQDANSKPKQPLAYYVMLGIGLALITAFVMFVQGFSSCFGNPSTSWCSGGSGAFYMFGLPVLVFLAVLIHGISKTKR